MDQKFSERMGLSQRPVLQIESMTQELRNSLWNQLRRILGFEGTYGNYVHSVRYLCEFFFKMPVDLLPFDKYRYKKWLRDLFYGSDFKWYKVYDLVEFVIRYQKELKIYHPKERMISDINEVLEREISGYRIVGESFVPISNQDEVKTIEEAIDRSKEEQLYGAQQHLESAIAQIAKKPQPDCRNSIKESISAVESLAKQISGKRGGGLKGALDVLDEKVNFHGAFKQGLLSLYGYTSDSDGIRHAILDEPNLDLDDAKYMLVICSALVNFMISKALKVGLIS